MLSEGENFLRALSGEVPEYVPIYNIFWSVRPSINNGDRVDGVGKDIFGVEWAKEGSAVDAAMPKMDKFILDDIRRWPDVIKAPDFSGVDWEAMARKDLANRNPDLPRGGGTAAQGFFQTLMSTMGFTNGLIACYEEPEEVRAMMEYLCDFYLSYAEPYLKYYEPEYIAMGDDIAHERGPFVSLECFHEVFAPVWRRYIGFFKDRGYLAIHHNCGRFEPLVDDIVDMGFNAWEPAQTCNNLVAIKAKYGRRFLIGGGFDSRPFLPHLELTEDEVRAMVKETLDTFAPGGGYAFPPMEGSLDSTPIYLQRMEWIRDEFKKLRTTYY